MEQVQRLDILLNVICESEQPTARFVLEKVLWQKLGIADPAMLAGEADMLIAVLLDDDFITEEESSNQQYYSATLAGVEFRQKGGYTADYLHKADKETKKDRYDQRQQEGYISPKYALIVSCLALMTTIVIFIHNQSNNPTQRIEQLEQRVDSLQRRMK